MFAGLLNDPDRTHSRERQVHQGETMELDTTDTEGDSPASIAPLQSAAASRTELKHMTSFGEKLQQTCTDFGPHAEIDVIYVVMLELSSRVESEQIIQRVFTDDHLSRVFASQNSVNLFTSTH